MAALSLGVEFNTKNDHFTFTDFTALERVRPSPKPREPARLPKRSLRGCCPQPGYTQLLTSPPNPSPSPGPTDTLLAGRREGAHFFRKNVSSPNPLPPAAGTPTDHSHTTAGPRVQREADRSHSPSLHFPTKHRLLSAQHPAPTQDSPSMLEAEAQDSVWRQRLLALSPCSDGCTLQAAQVTDISFDF